MCDETTVYKAWPLDDIATAREEFRDNMHDGATIEELEAGLWCLDFLCRKSEIPEDNPLTWMLQSTIDEAHMRIALMREGEAQAKNHAETLEKAVNSVRNLKRFVETLIPRMSSVGATHLARRFPFVNYTPPTTFDEDYVEESEGHV